MNIKNLHERCLISAKNFKLAEKQIIADLAEAMRHKIYHHYNCASAHEYVVKQLGLSDELAYIFTRVAGKTLQVPELGAALQKGEITVSKANRLTAVLKPDNQAHWLGLAKSISKNQLERKIAEQAPLRERANWVHPQHEVKEKVSLTRARIQLQVGISEATMLKIRRVQDLLCQQQGKALSLEQTFEAMANFFVERKDPVAKAKRQKIRGKLEQSVFKIMPGQKNKNIIVKKHSLRRPIPSPVKHAVQLKYNGQCGHQDERGERCSQKRWLHVHHKRPVADGGSNEFSNLILLCAGHHRLEHVHKIE